MPALCSALLIVVFCYLSTFLYSLFRNTFSSRRSNFPFITIPWDQNHFLWMVTSVPLRPILQRLLPTSIYNRLVLTIYGWEFHQRLQPFKDYVRGAKSFMLVTCGKLEFSTYDAEIASEILRRPRDFAQLDLTSLFMGRFGGNVLISNGDSWARQRKVVAGVINERISRATFEESVRQTEGLLGEIFLIGENGNRTAETNRMFDMMKKITINVLSGAGMGTNVSWEDKQSEKAKPGCKLNYITAVKSIIANITGPLILPQWFLDVYPHTYLPGGQTLKTLAHAVREFPVHTMDMLDTERKRSEGSEARGNIMSQLLRANETEAKNKALSDEEMMGNLFIFTAAGFDTTANTLAFALVLLARYPHWQDWLFEEIDALTPPELEKLSYTAIFPRANRILAFMLETLRLYPPVIHIAKQTHAEQTLQTSTGTYWLPANTNVYIDTVALGLDPDIWRDLNLHAGEEGAENDEERFRPSRFINVDEKKAGSVLFQAPKGTFLPWSGGPRVCPGQKMAQVEFVGVLLALLKRHRVEAVKEAGESEEMVQERLKGRMRKCTAVLTLQMDGVYDVGEGEGKEEGLSLRLAERK